MAAYAHTPNDQGNWHDLVHHLQKVAGRSRTLARKLGLPEMGYYAGLWHDLGKYNPDFQAYLQACARNGSVAAKVPHAKYGALLAAETCPLLAPIIYGHHSGLPSTVDLRNRLAEIDQSIYQQVQEAATAEGIDLVLPETVLQEIANISEDCDRTELQSRIETAHSVSSIASGKRCDRPMPTTGFANGAIEGIAFGLLRRIPATDTGLIRRYISLCKSFMKIGFTSYIASIVSIEYV